MLALCQQLSMVFGRLLNVQATPADARQQRLSATEQLSLNLLVLLFFSTSRFVLSQNVTSSFNFLTFNSSLNDQLLLVGDALHMPNTSSIWLNGYNNNLTDSGYTCGSLMYANPVRFRDSSAPASTNLSSSTSTTASPAVASFSTSFTFSMTGTAVTGFAFVIALTNNDTYRLSPGASMCVLYKDDNGKASNHVVAVEFDTWGSSAFNDPSNNHVGVNVNSMNSTKSHNLCPDNVMTSCGYLVTGRNFTSWVDYDSASQSLEVRFVEGSIIQGVARPSNALIQVPQLDISQVVHDFMYVGFRGSNIRNQEIHDIKSWSFTTGKFVSTENPTTRVIEGRRSSRRQVALISATVSVGFCLIVVGLVVHCILQGKRRRRERKTSSPDVELIHNSSTAASDMIEQDLKWPRQFSYKELRRATNDFSEERLLGQGGFGQVYKGTLQLPGTAGAGSTSLDVAVKRTKIEKANKAGVKGFLAELSVISRIRHRNLLQLNGWCREDNHLLLVYECMANGSLEKWLFVREDKPSAIKTWDVRQHILTGVAAAIAYLHEGWDQCILHRDIKTANVLLDQHFNAHVGDFGLARFINHSKTVGSTAVTGAGTGAGGTPGYMAPEMYEGSVTQKSDVYSFGILALELACGRRVVDPSLVGNLCAEPAVSLLECVWRAHESQNLLSVADPRLQNQLSVEQMRCILQLGLLCCLPDPNTRPIMRAVHQFMIDGEVAVLPPLPLSRPKVVWEYTSEDLDLSGGVTISSVSALCLEPSGDSATASTPSAPSSTPSTPSAPSSTPSAPSSTPSSISWGPSSISPDP